MALVVQNLPANAGEKRCGFDPWIRKWQPSPVFLPGELHGQRSLLGYTYIYVYIYIGVERVRHDWEHTHTHTQQPCRVLWLLDIEVTVWCHRGSHYPSLGSSSYVHRHRVVVNIFHLVVVLASVKQLRKCASDTLTQVFQKQKGAAAENLGEGFAWGGVAWGLAGLQV